MMVNVLLNCSFTILCTVPTHHRPSPILTKEVLHRYLRTRREQYKQNMAMLLASIHPVHITHLLRALHKSSCTMHNVPQFAPLFQLFIHSIHWNHIACWENHHHCCGRHWHHQMCSSLFLTLLFLSHHLRVEIQIRRQCARCLVVAEEQQVLARAIQTTHHMPSRHTLHSTFVAQALIQCTALLTELITE